MQQKKKWSVISLVFLTILVVGPKTGLSAPCIPCESLPTIDFGPEVTIASSVISTEITVIGPDGPIAIPVPEHCDVRGFIAPEQGFNVKLPTATWNSKLYMVGNSVAAGMIQEDSMLPGLFQGYATAGTDTGHQGSPIDWSFGYNPPDNSNPNAEEKLADYCDESIHETTVLAKAIIGAYYCTDPSYSYYVGCSTGGRQGLIEAQMYPEDFDGILVGAPVHHLAEIQMRGIWEGLQLSGPGAVDAAKLPLLTAAVMKRCDSIDGLVDGVIDNPISCDFDAREDLPACEDDVDAPDCFTNAQRDAVYAIYDGPRNSAGELLTFGEAFGSEAMDGPTSGWTPWLVWPDGPMHSLALMVGIGAIQHIGLDPAPGPTWDFTTFDFDADWTNVMDNFGATCNADDPDLSAFKALGGKMIHYDGWADAATGPYQSLDYYENVLSVMGNEATREFYKLYMIPGMFHCGGGIGCYDINALFAALVNWVEGGVEPTSYTGTRPDGARTRPMCPHPQVARYLGEGSIDDAENFACVETISAKAGIMPPMLKLNKKGKFIARIHTPKGLDMRGWKNTAIVCEGALADKVKRIRKFWWWRPNGRGSIYFARFHSSDLINITKGDDVTFTVTAIFEKDGQRLALEGSDSVRVIE